MTTMDLAWAAGLFDGEGCADVHRTSDACPRFRIQIGQSGSREVLDRFRNSVDGLGKVYGPYEQPNGRKARYLYSVRGTDAEAVAMSILPFVSSVKADQISAAIATIEEAE